MLRVEPWHVIGSNEKREKGDEEPRSQRKKKTNKEKEENEKKELFHFFSFSMLINFYTHKQPHPSNN